MADEKPKFRSIKLSIEESVYNELATFFRLKLIADDITHDPIESFTAVVLKAIEEGKPSVAVAKKGKVDVQKA